MTYIISKYIYFITGLNDVEDCCNFVFLFLSHLLLVSTLHLFLVSNVTDCS